MALTFCVFSPCEQNDYTLFDVNELCKKGCLLASRSVSEKGSRFSCKHIYSQRCVNTVNIYRCSQGGTGTFSFFPSLFFCRPFPCDTRRKAIVCMCVYFWKHFKVICAPTKNEKKKKITLRKCNDVPTLSIKLRRARRRREADSKANAGLVGVLNMN